MCILEVKFPIILFLCQSSFFGACVLDAGFVEVQVVVFACNDMFEGHMSLIRHRLEKLYRACLFSFVPRQNRVFSKTKRSLRGCSCSRRFYEGRPAFSSEAQWRWENNRRSREGKRRGFLLRFRGQATQAETAL